MSQDEAVSEGSVGGVKAAVSGLFGKLCSVDPRLWAVICLLGFLMMLFGTLLFVFAPEEAYEAIFIVGVVLLVLGYTLLFLGNARVRSEAEAIDAEEEENGFFYILDDCYSSSTGDATIEDLTRR